MAFLWPVQVKRVGERPGLCALEVLSCDLGIYCVAGAKETQFPIELGDPADHASFLDN